jgi:hypothetical protein
VDVVTELGGSSLPKKKRWDSLRISISLPISRLTQHPQLRLQHPPLLSQSSTKARCIYHRVACGCCHRARGFELTEKEKMGFLTDFHIVDDNSVLPISRLTQHPQLRLQHPPLLSQSSTKARCIYRQLGAGHCMVACGCCHRARGFELTEKEKMGFLTDLTINATSTATATAPSSSLAILN